MTSSFWLAYIQIDGWWTERKHEQALADQKAALEKSCKENAAITKGANDELQKKYYDIASKRDYYKRLYENSIVVPAPRSTEPVSLGEQYARRNGAVAGTTDDFRDYAAKCESYRQERITLEKFYDGVKRKVEAQH